MSEISKSTGITWGDVTFYSMSIVMIFAPVIGYIDQIIKFRKINSSEGYSTKISLILLLSNTFRLFFWIGKRFSLVWVFQSIVMMLMQVILLISSLKFKVITDKSSKFNCKNFWEWPFLSDYFHFYSLVIIVIGILTPLALSVGTSLVYFEILGIMSAATEASLQIPQIYQFFLIKSGSSLSYILIATWVLGDFSKTIYMIVTDSPMQMILCGTVQVLFDFIIISQVFWYNKMGEKQDKIETELTCDKDSTVSVN